MSGNGVGMMNKFIEANGLTNSESPAIFVAVHKALDIKLKRIEAIKNLYEADGDKAPMTTCPECGSPSLIVRNCEFCGYAMLEGEGSNEVSVETKTTEKETRTSRRGKSNDSVESEEKTTTPDKPETTREARQPKVKEAVIPTKEEINKARRPGLIKIVKAHSLTMTSDLDKAELKEIRIELLEKLLGESAPVEETKTRTPKTETKKAPIVTVVDFSKAPDAKALENMTEEKLIKVIGDFKLPISETVDKLKGELADDDAFFACVDEIAASLKSEAKNQSKAEPVEETKTRAKRGAASEPKTKAVKLIEINIDDLPEKSAMEEMNEDKLLKVISDFGLNLADDVAALKKGGLDDDAFFEVVDNIDSKIEGIANDINDGKKPTYPAVLEVKAKTARAKKSPATEPTLEEGNETDSNYEDIDLDNADISYDDINIEDVEDQTQQ